MNPALATFYVDTFTAAIAGTKKVRAIQTTGKTWSVDRVDNIGIVDGEAVGVFVLDSFGFLGFIPFWQIVAITF